MAGGFFARHTLGHLQFQLNREPTRKSWNRTMMKGNLHVAAGTRFYGARTSHNRRNVNAPLPCHTSLIVDKR
jgi:hypothetical protein